MLLCFLQHVRDAATVVAPRLREILGIVPVHVHCTVILVRVQSARMVEARSIVSIQIPKVTSQ